MQAVITDWNTSRVVPNSQQLVSFCDGERREHRISCCRIADDRFESARVITTDQFDLFVAENVCVVAEIETDLRGQQIRGEVGEQREVCLFKAVDTEKLDPVLAEQLIEDMEVREVEQRLKQRLSTSSSLNLGEGIRLKRLKLLLICKELLGELQPVAAAEFFAEGHAVQEQTEHHISIRKFRT